MGVFVMNPKDIENPIAEADFKAQMLQEKFDSGELCGCQSSKGFNPDLPGDCRKCPNKRIEWIICPDCSMNQEAVVIPTIPSETRIHECEQCGYIITESEWLIDSD